MYSGCAPSRLVRSAKYWLPQRVCASTESVDPSYTRRHAKKGLGADWPLGAVAHPAHGSSLFELV